MLFTRPNLLPGFVLLCLSVLPGTFHLSYTHAAEEPLIWKFSTGDEHRYQMTQKMKTAMELGPAGEVKTGFQQQMNIRWKIESVDEKGAATLTQQIERVQLAMHAPGQVEMRFDTASEEAPAGYGAMVAPALQA
ncbi:MAG: hypothetical protein MI673_03415, partial [Thiotrichales bacterium]|nr:hypothetical protein [Thiotrichales bacterium]